MNVLNLAQGSSEWLEARKGTFTASLAPSVMGDGYDSRDKAMRYFLGIEKKEISNYLQSMFDAGHEAEEKARPVAEDYIGKPLSPLVGIKEVHGMKLLASFDGIDFDSSVVWECKNTSKTFDEVPMLYIWQMEHQMIVSGAKDAVLTVVSRNDGALRHYDYQSKPERQEQLIDGWKQWQKDIESYERTDAEWLELANSYKHIKDHIETLTKEQKEVTKKLQVLAGHQSAVGGGVKVSVSESWERKETPAAYIKANGIVLATTKLDTPEYGYRITVSK
jgi:predicted phage-related endonuclease